MPAKQETLLKVDVKESAVGSEIVNDLTKVQSVKSVTLTVYVFAIRLLISSVVLPFDQANVKGTVPPVIIKSIAPLEPPLQLTLVETAVMVVAEDSFTVAEVTVVQKFPSLMVTL